MSGSSGNLRAVGLLTAVMVIAWVLCFWPARYFSGPFGVWWMTLAAVCCLVPGWFVVMLSGLPVFANDLALMVVTTMVRLFSVAGAAVVVKQLKPDLRFQDFFGWLVGFYLLALAVEVWCLRPVGQSHQEGRSV
ncbi:MAG: hypothetical protein KDA89_06455 [Planctomycetaceae bacterium]|nr:hypothetical protein [Planctomycetaceae bacterium]